MEKRPLPGAAVILLLQPRNTTPAEFDFLETLPRIFLAKALFAFTIF